MRLHLSLLLLTLLASPVVFSHGNEKHSATAMKPGRDSTSAQLDIDVAANDAVATVERFSTALAAGDLTAATAELDPSVLILESGGAEHSRDEYLAGHAKSDAEFLKAAHVTLRRRTAHAAGELAWVGSESEIHVMKGADMLMISSSETMVVRKTTEGWKIVHIHWSSRKAAPPATTAVPPRQPSAVVPAWMSPADVQVLTSGAGAGMASAAEAHGLPGPKHVLELEKQLGLSAAQRNAMLTLQAEMSASATERGRQVLDAEAALDAEMAAASPSASRIRALTREVGLARSAVRDVHLTTHLKAAPLLTPGQLARYRELRASRG